MSVSRERALVLSAEVRSVLDALRDPVVAADETNRVLFANAAVERMLGWPLGELVGKSLSQLIPSRFRAAHEAGLARFFRSGELHLTRPVRVPAIARDGQEIDIELTLSELQGHPGAARIVIAIMRDLRERIELERRLATRQRMLAQRDAISVLASAASLEEAIPRVLQATATASNWELAAYWGQDGSSDRLSLRAAWSLVPQLDAAWSAASSGATFGVGEGLLGRVLSSGEPLWEPLPAAGELSARAAVASQHGLRTTLLFPVHSQRGSTGVLEYLTTRSEEPDEVLLETMHALGFQIAQFLERLRSEEQLRRVRAEVEVERDNLRMLFTEAPAAISILRGADYRYVLSNPRHTALAGGRQIVGKTVREALPELMAAGLLVVADHVYATGESRLINEYPVEMVEQDGSKRTVYVNGVIQPLRGLDGQVDGLMSFSYEVTELVLARARVEQAEERLRLAVEAGNLGTWDFDPHTGELRSDARYKTLFGAPPDFELTNEELQKAVHPDDLGRVMAAVQHALDAESDGLFTIEYRTRGIADGIERWVSMRGRALFEGGVPTRFVGTGVDVTRERAARERLKLLSEASTLLASSLDYRHTLGELTQLVVPRMVDACIVHVLYEGGEQAPWFVAQPEHAALRRSVDFASNSAVVRSLREGVEHFVSEADEAALATLACDGEHLAQLERVRPGSWIIVPLALGPRTLGLLALFQVQSKRRFRSDDVALAHELSRRISLALENARLFAASQAAIQRRDDFLSIASHELKTPVTSLGLYLDAFVRDAERGELGSLAPDKLLSRVTKAKRQVERLTRLINELLDVSRIASEKLLLDRQVIDLLALVREVKSRLSEQAKAAGTPVEITSQKPVVGFWDRERLEQVATNLLGNALKYAPGKPIEISLESTSDFAILSVRDRGPGISLADQSRIFERFERTPEAKDIGGFGLGLWIVHKVVTAHGGTVRVESEHGQGARFVVELPKRTGDGEASGPGRR